MQVRVRTVPLIRRTRRRYGGEASLKNFVPALMRVTEDRARILGGNSRGRKAVDGLATVREGVDGR
jgi:hypothetical protein